ncbi:hypothetical protein ACHAXA_001664, partial [Cyclostephanos tholiformis]
HRNASSSSACDNGKRGGGRRQGGNEREETLARRCGIRVGNIIVAVNGLGYHRFRPDYESKDDLEDVTLGRDLINMNDKDDDNDGGNGGRGEEEEEEDGRGDAMNWMDDVNDEDDGDGGQTMMMGDKYMRDMERDQCWCNEKEGRKIDKACVVTSSSSGKSYDKLLLHICNIKSASSTSKSSSSPKNKNVVYNPLILLLEQYSWDSRVHSWKWQRPDGHGCDTKTREVLIGIFPIDLTFLSLLHLFRSRAVSVIDQQWETAMAKDHSNVDDVNCGGDDNVKALVLYIPFKTLQQSGVDTDISYDTLSDNTIRAFVVYTEMLLSKSPDPGSLKMSHFVDLTNISLKDSILGSLCPLLSESLLKLYGVFKLNYPKTLKRLVVYPVPKLLVKAMNAMLTFVNVHMRKKFVVNNY